MDNKKIKLLLLGIRKDHNISQSELSKKLGICRQSISRYEANQRIPNQESIVKINDFIYKNNFNVSELIEIGNSFSKEYFSREKFDSFILENSSEFAELIGIILGDGEIRKDGEVRISFDPKKDQNFIKRRVLLLIKKLIKSNIRFESNKRISFYNIAFVRFLRDKHYLFPGSKFLNNWEIPLWCFEKKEYISSVLRGLFDTDGYIGYCCGTIEIMYGRFSIHSNNLIKSMNKALILLGFNPIIKYSPDGRCKIRIFGKSNVIRFMIVIGSSNIKNIIRFLLWRIYGYPAKIEKEGLNFLLNLTNKVTNKDILNIKLPFYWEFSRFNELNNVKDDNLFCITRITRPKHL